MSIALVQSVIGGSASATVVGANQVITTTPVGFPAPTGAGNLLVAVVYATIRGTVCDAPVSIGPVTSGITWGSGIGARWFNSSPRAHGWVFLSYAWNAPSIPASTTTVVSMSSATSSGSNDLKVEFDLYEFSGVRNTSQPFDTSGNVESGTNTTPTGGILTTTDTDLVIAIFGSDTGTNIAAGSGFTLGINAATAIVGQMQYQLNVPAGLVNTAFTGGTEPVWKAQAGAFKAAPVTAILNITPATLTFFALQGGSNPASQSIDISNGNGGTLDWSITSDQPWLTVAPASGSDAATVAASIDITGLAAGVYTGNITVTAAGATGSPQVVVVTLSISTPAPPPPDVTDSTAREPRNPVIMLRWSDDGGHTWSNEHRLDCGSVGQYKRRVIARRLGRARDRVYEIAVSDPVPWRIIEAYLNPRSGK